MRVLVTFLTLEVLLGASAVAQEQDTHYDRTIDAVYATIDGVDFYMDVFVPNGTAAPEYLGPNEKGKGLAIIDVVSGAWSAGRGKLKDHEQARFFSIFTAHGYTLFAIRPGSKGDYDALDMVDHVRHGIRYVKANAEQYGIDPDRIGLTGASAGAHLAALTVTSQREDTVKALGIFFPPADFLDWEGEPASEVAEVLGGLYFVGGTAGKTEAEVAARAEAVSPARRVTPGLPPLRVYHGDADPLVPLQQSERLVAAWKKAGNEAELIVKKGGGHPWMTIPFEIMDLANWFDEELAK